MCRSVTVVREFLANGPFWAVFAAMFVLAMLRGQMMYWIGRLPTEQALKRIAPTSGWQARAHRWLSDGGADAGIASIRRWGLPVVSVGYVTIGFQSVVQAGAGVLRVPLPWYLLAQVPGALAWALIYSTIGFAVWAAVIAAAAGSPWGIAGIIALVAAIISVVVILRRRRTTRDRIDAPVP